VVMRRDVSFLFSEGHIHAAHYPLWQLQLETELAYQRVNKNSATEAVLVRAAVAATDSKESSAEFKKILDELNPELK